MSGRTSRKPGPRAGTFGAGTRRPALARPGYLARASGLISIPKLQPNHAGEKIGFGASSLTALAQSWLSLGLRHAPIGRMLRVFLQNWST